ncbi:MAG: baseplate J/gp47 family protein [Clostridiales bacterium]|nr:baseplate J/gp47 family protein [Clostridiales bacterium]
MFENITVESLKRQMLEEITEVDTREGSYMNTMVSGVAYQVWELYQSMNALIPIAFVDETSGEYIDKRAGEFGLTRKKGTKATAKMEFTGKAGTEIPAGSVFLTEDGLEYLLEKTVVLGETGSGEGKVTAAEEGERYNTEAGTITGQYKTIAGLTDVTNLTAATGGTEAESDKAFVNRLYEFWRKPASSGNIYHYKQWAKEVDGVGEAKVFPLWNGNGTVKVVVCSQKHLAVNEEILKALQEHIEKVRPIGAAVTVESAKEKEINVTAQVKLDQTRTLEEVTAEIKEKVTNYLKDMAFEGSEVIYHQIAYLILGTKGVTDYKALTLNGGEENISLEANEIAVAGKMEVTSV